MTLIELPASIDAYVASMDVAELGGLSPEVSTEQVGPGLFRTELRFRLDHPVQQDDWRVTLRPAFVPEFHWAPHLTPTAEHVIDQHVFRSPALVVSNSERVVRLVPDLDVLGASQAVPWYLDLDAQRGELVLGMSQSAVREHVLFVREPGAAYPAGEVTVGFYLIVSDEPDEIANPFRSVLAFLWERWAREKFEAGEPLPGDLSAYVSHTYRWAFEGWADSVWQEWELDGRRVGGPSFIVNHTQSPNYQGVPTEREFVSIWNQAWFSALRSGSGLFRHARRSDNSDLMRRALLAKELALSAPQHEGLFPSVIATSMESVEVDGETARRSQGWATASWGNSNRNPINYRQRSTDPADAPHHILDMSFTALLMLRWYQELEPDERLLAYATRYGDRLLTLQGLDDPVNPHLFPAWLELTEPTAGDGVTTLERVFTLDDSPETAMSVTFLLKLAAVGGDDQYISPALRALDALVADVVPVGRWEDFETYWSCSHYGADSLLGTKIARNDMYKQNSLSMFWTAEALLEAFDLTGQARYLEVGRRVLDEMLMMQASWQPDYMYVNVLGGFGVMNGDAEWNDARGSLFAELIIRYGERLDCAEYRQRGLAAMRSCFVMMYCPENPRTKTQWERRHPFFGPEDYGFTMENYGHGGSTSVDGDGMGTFTIYDWGNGAAAEAYNRLLDHFDAGFVTGPR